MSRELQVVSHADLERVIGGVRMAHLSDWMLTGVMVPPTDEPMYPEDPGPQDGCIGMDPEAYGMGPPPMPQEDQMPPQRGPYDY